MTSNFESKYKILQKIGEGSFSDVLKCRDIYTSEYYAAKQLRKVYRSEKEIKNCAEVMAMQKLQWHPNIIHMIEYFHDQLTGRVTFVIELMDISLYEFIKKKKRCVSEAKAKYYLYQILKGLQHLHKSGLFHRDVKPENVLMRLPTFHNPREVVKLADLGSIRGIYSTPPYTEYISTRWYRSPECLLTVGHYGPKMDIWASGCVFYETLTLKPLFPGKDEIDQLSRIHAVLGTPPEGLINKLKSKSINYKCFPKQQGCGLEKMAKGLSEGGIAALKQMLQYDPNRRITVKRLVEHRYFSDLRQNESGESYVLPAGQKFAYYPNKDGFATTPNLPVEKIKLRDTHMKTRFPSTMCQMKNSKTAVDVCDREVPLQPKTNNLYREGRKPIVKNSVIRSWGIDPYILSPFHKTTEDVKHCVKPMKLTDRGDNKRSFAYSRTISDLPKNQIKKRGTKRFENTSVKSKSSFFESGNNV